MPLFRRSRPKAKVVGTVEPLPQHQIRGSRKGGRLDLPPGTIRFDGAHLEDVDLEGQTIANYVAFGSTFERCSFRNVKIQGGVLGHLPIVVYRDCDFTGADLQQVNPMMSRFEGCIFDRALLDDWRAVCSEFVRCHFAGRLVRVKFCGRPLEPCASRLSRVRRRNEFIDNDFKEAELVDCRISGGIDIARQQWSSDPAYIKLDRLQDRILKTRHVIEEEWPIGQDRDNALSFLEVFSTYDYSDQQGLVMRRDDVYDYGSWADRVWSLLENS